MTRATRLILLSSLSWMADGCVPSPNPTDNPFQGIFKVTSHTRNEADCNGIGVPITDGDKFIKLTEEPPRKTKILAYRSCSDASSCSPERNFAKSFLDEGKGWMQQVKAATPRGTDKCFLQLLEGPLVKTDSGFTLDTKSFEGTITLGNGETCHPDIIDSHRAALSCLKREVIAAEKQ